MARDKKFKEVKEKKKIVKTLPKKIKTDKKKKPETIVEETPKTPQINQVIKPKVKTVRDLLKEDVLDKLKNGEIKVADIDNALFQDMGFYNKVVELAKAKVTERFEEITAGVKNDDEATKKLAEALDKKINMVVEDLKSRRAESLNALVRNAGV